MIMEHDTEITSSCGYHNARCTCGWKSPYHWDNPNDAETNARHHRMRHAKNDHGVKPDSDNQVFCGGSSSADTSAVRESLSPGCRHDLVIDRPESDTSECQECGEDLPYGYAPVPDLAELATWAAANHDQLVAFHDHLDALVADDVPAAVTVAGWIRDAKSAGWYEGRCSVGQPVSPYEPEGSRS